MNRARADGAMPFRLIPRSSWLLPCTDGRLPAFIGTMLMALALQATAVPNVEAAGSTSDTHPPASILAQLFPRPTTAQGQSATLLPDGRWLLLGGYATEARQPLAAAVVIDPATRRPRALSVTLAHERAGHTATVLPDGRVLILGGTMANGNVAPPEMYDDAAGASETVASSLGLIERTMHAATLLADGRLLITGGLSSRGLPLADAELLNTHTFEVERFNARSDAARFGHLSHLLPSHAVLLLGGYDIAKRPVPDAEMYDAARARFVPLTMDKALQAARDLSAPSAPLIVDTQPAEHSRDVPVGQVIVARLSKRMLVPTMNGDTVTLIGPTGAVPATVVPAEAGLLLFVKPKQHLMPASTYTLFIKGATDELGQAVPFTAVAFTTQSLAGGQTANVDAMSSASTLASSRAGMGAADVLAELITPLPAPEPLRSAAPSGAASKQARPQAVRPDTSEDWLLGAGHQKGQWYFNRPFAGTMREYFQHVQDRSSAHRAALLSAPQGVTAIAGSVLRANGQPLAGVTLAIGRSRTVSDALGRFLLTDVPAGEETMVVEGSTANRADAFYGSYLRQVSLKVGQTLQLDEPIYLTKLDPKGTIRIPSPTQRDLVVGTPTIPGLQIRIPAGTVIRDRNGNILTAINISPVPLDRAAFPMPRQAEFPVYFTVQPSGAYIQSVAGGAARPLKVIYPNYGSQPAGTPVDFWAYDPEIKGWHSYGQGAVSADGKTIEPAANVGFYRFTGFSFGFSGTGGGSGPDPCGDCDCGGSAGAGGGSSAGSGSGGDGDDGAGAGSSPLSATCGDPVLLARGTFLHSMTDLVVADLMPLALERTFMDKDTLVRSFGIGMTHRFDMNLHVLEANGAGDAFHHANKVALIQPNGVQIVFKRVLSNGPGNYDTTWEHAGAGPFHKAVLVSTPTQSQIFTLRMRDGTSYVFYGYAGNMLQSITDRNGNTIEIARFPALSGRVTKIISTHGRFVQFNYDGNLGTVTTIKDNIGRTVSYEYIPQGQPNAIRLKKVTMPDGGTWQYTYTAAGRIEAVTDARNNRMVLNEYDANGRIKKQTYADNHNIQIAYTTDANGQVTQADVTDKRGYVRRVSFGASQKVMQSTYPLGQPEQQTTSFVRDAESGAIASQTDALNRTTRYTYDSLGNVASVTRLHGTPDAVTETFTYDPAFSQVKTSTDALSRTTTYGYDGKGNLTEIKDANQNAVVMTRDGFGRLLTSRNALNHVTTWTYAGPDLGTVTDPLLQVTQYGHDAAGRLLVTRDPLGNANEYAYDGMDRTVQRRDANGNSVAYEYDAMGNLRTHRDENGNPTVFTPNAMNQAQARRDALLASDSRQHDAAGNLVRLTDRKGQVSGRRYDALNRLVFMGYGATTAAPTTYTNGIRYTWDAGNRLTKLEDGTCAGVDCASFTVAATIDRGYDGLDRLTQETSPQGQVNYTYYPNGLRQTMTVAGQPTVNYGYDLGNRLTQIQQAAGVANGNVVQTIGFQYDNADRRTKTTLANGITMNYGYDNASRLTSIVYKRADGSTIADLAYGYDLSGRRTSVSGSLANTELPAEATAASHNANNQLTAWAGATLSYDANGSLTHDGSHAYLWNSRNQLAEIRQGTDTGPVVASYRYDASGRRSARTVGAGTTGYLYDGWNVVQELNAAAANAGKTNYKANVLNGFALDERYARLVAPSGSDVNLPKNVANPSATAPMVTSLLTDALGSTLIVTKADQVTQSSFGYEPYGRTVQSTPVGQVPSDIPYQYTGREFEGASAVGNQLAMPHSSLYHYRNRYYSTEIHRFVHEDPIGLDGGSNVYRYVNGNPISLSDPEGLQSAPVGPLPVPVPPVGVPGTPENQQMVEVTFRLFKKIRDLCFPPAPPPDCREERRAAADICAKLAQTQGEDAPHVWGGSLDQCIRNVLPEACGGEPKWKGRRKRK